MIKKVITILLLLIMYLQFGCKPKSESTLSNNKRTQSPDSVIFISKLDSALRYLESVCGADGINRTVVLYQGREVYRGNESDAVQNVWSCTKSFTSTVLGLLIDEGKCSLDQKVCDFLPELKEHYPNLTFRHFATMTSGYHAIGDEPIGDYIHGPSKIPFIPSPEPLFVPGNEFRYWDSAMNMFAYALTIVAGESLEDYFKRKVANVIGMNPENWKWNYFMVNNTTVNGGAGNHSKGIHISASEFARFGQLMLQKGVWEGKRIISENWINQATSPQVKNVIPNDTTCYGFNWWTAENFENAPGGTFAAKGFNNNKCLIIPALELVVVRLGLDGNISDEYWNSFIKILSE